jgi:two-component system response regulator AdeR
MDNALILIIEDEPEIVDILERYLEREGFRTVSAGDGDTGLSHHQRLKPDLIVLDIKLPRQDGYEVLSAIRRRDDTPVIMVTALAEDLDKLQALRIGADDYVVKPFNPLEVVARAKTIFAARQRRKSGPASASRGAGRRSGRPCRLGRGQIRTEATRPYPHRVSHPRPYGALAQSGF